MRQVQINAFLRKDIGKKHPKKLREKGYVPAIVYGGAQEFAISVSMSDLAPHVATAEVCFFELNLGDKKILCILQSIQKDPVSEILLHLDFLELVASRPIKMQIPLRLKGKAPGVLAGGVLEVLMPRVHVKALPNKMPEEITLDISALDLGKTLRIKNLVGSGLTFPAPELTPVVRVAIPRALKTATEE